MALDQNELGGIIQANVKRFRDEAGMTQEDMAAAAGVSVDAIRKWEGRRGVPGRESLTRMAQALGRRMDDFNMKEPPPPPVRKQPVFALKIAASAPDDLKKLAEEYIDQMNKQAVQRVEYPPGIRKANGQVHPMVTVRSDGSAGTKDRPRQPEPKTVHPSEQKRRRR